MTHHDPTRAEFGYEPPKYGPNSLFDRALDRKEEADRYVGYSAVRIADNLAAGLPVDERDVQRYALRRADADYAAAVYAAEAAKIWSAA